ncbi:protein translocase subunit SecF [Pelagibius sp. Alg239-R121]|uniref:protein translocase subunit SecF n=1 Tax=Pelagibius sp. Alg239-R121 TaxID=2993448 RepID=UPI0024A6317F|nr:protein translocase subunit SecF [Pelagibius sp. Alg239-R121]
MAIIKLFPVAPKLNFMSKRKLFLAFSALLMLGSVISFATLGLNFGVDFRGGILLEVRTDGPADLGNLRSRLSALDVGEVTLQEFGAPTDVLINIQKQDGGEGAQEAAIQLVKEALGSDVVEYRRTEFVGPKVGGELKEAGILATVLALGAIGLYIWFRFEWHFSAAALVALLHDVIATVGFFSLTQVEFNLSTLAAVLTIAGYSINDTVVIFDRVRDELRKYKKLAITEVLNMSINRTLSRTVLTSVTTLLALFSLFIFGGEVIRGFSMGLIWGVIIGTYSSVALAVPILSYMNIRVGVSDGPDKAEQAAPAAS